VGLGGNTPGTLEAFRRVRVALGLLLEDSAGSSLYRTRAQDDADQEDFWNAVVEGHWSGTVESLLERLLLLEAGEGRRRDRLRPKGPRVLDLDLLTFGTEVRTSSRLTLPHRGLAFRRFALEPLIELDPSAIDPRTRRLWSEALAALPNQGVDRTGRPW